MVGAAFGGVEGSGGGGVGCHEGKLVCCHKISVWKGGSCH